MKVPVVFYSMYGHVELMARAVAEGIRSVEEVEPLLRWAAEFQEIPDEKREDRHFLLHGLLPVRTGSAFAMQGSCGRRMVRWFARGF